MGSVVVRFGFQGIDQREEKLFGLMILPASLEFVYAIDVFGVVPTIVSSRGPALLE